MLFIYNEYYNEDSVNFISKLFSSDVADKNVQMPLHQYFICDQIMWDWDSSGKYTAKSGYKIYLENFLNG